MALYEVRTDASHPAMLWKLPIAAGRHRVASQSLETFLFRYQIAGVALMVCATERFHAYNLRLFQCSKFDLSLMCIMSASDQRFLQ